MSTVDELLTRGMELVYPSPEIVRERLASGRPLTIYFGIDPTGPTLHLGTATVLLKLRDFQKLGHQVIILYGDFTARIGDPSDKLAARKQLTAEEVASNLKSYRRQIGKILDLKKTIFKKNNSWLGKLKLGQVLELASEFTVAQLLERDMFQERIKANAPVYFHEMFYPVLQGYDSVAMGVDAEIGANDQTFNMLVGRTMMSRRGKEKLVFATKLLVDPSGKKMGKTEGNMIRLDDGAGEMYGKVMSWPDELMPLGYEICTRLPYSKNDIPADPKEAKMKLAREIVAIFHGASRAARAEKSFVSTFQKRELPSSLPEYVLPAGLTIVDALTLAGLAKSKSAARSLVLAGAVAENGEQKITDPYLVVVGDLVVRVGKRNFVRFRVN